MADFLVALADFDRQRLWVQLGHSSVFYYLHRDLCLSTGAAHYRKVAAHLIQKFPEVVELTKVITRQQRRGHPAVLPPVEAGGQGGGGGNLSGDRDPEAGGCDGVARCGASRGGASSRRS